ncbi:TPA: hypothetical protein SL386_001653 [Pseudomonas aeruginosa]|nr:hypothetical protein [Pseudomonas aeruginosa]HEJ6312622.1 hypothetical protein [Pseudomonas aeruginosa]
MNKALDLLREIRPSIPKEVLELWCKDRDAFLASHSAVEQAGGDERAAFELFVRKHCGMPEHIAVNWDAKFTNDAWEAWQARAALAQPSPMRCLACGGYHGNSGLPCPNMRVTAQAQPSPAQAEAERPELWAVHAQGPDELYAAFTREDAEKHAAELNALPMPEGIAVGAVVVPSPWPEAEHWKYLAEQERDHKNEIAGRLRQFERICEGLPQGAIDGGWTAQGIRGYAKRLEDQLKAALARVAELELKLDKSDYAYDNDRIHMRGLAARAIARAKVFDDGSDGADAESARSVVAILRELLAVGPAQAQHSVPVVTPEMVMAAMAVFRLDVSPFKSMEAALIAALRKAAAPGKEDV